MPEAMRLSLRRCPKGGGGGGGEPRSGSFVIPRAALAVGALLERGHGNALCVVLLDFSGGIAVANLDDFVGACTLSGVVASAYACCACMRLLHLSRLLLLQAAPLAFSSTPALIPTLPRSWCCYHPTPAAPATRLLYRCSSSYRHCCWAHCPIARHRPLSAVDGRERKGWGLAPHPRSLQRQLRGRAVSRSVPSSTIHRWVSRGPGCSSAGGPLCQDLGRGGNARCVMLVDFSGGIAVANLDGFVGTCTLSDDFVGAC
jgi:hypothetical protein